MAINMKEYVKLFEQFINESNETIKAQGGCKNAMFILQKDLNGLLKRMTDLKILASFSTKVEIYNTGYQLRLITKMHDDIWKGKKETLSPADEFGSSFVSSNSYIYLEPGSFFEDYLEEGKGAYIEGRTLQLGKDTKGIYPRYDIKTKGDIDTSIKKYVEEVQTQIADAYSKLEINESDRSGLMGNYQQHQDPSQSMTNFSIGDMVHCINPDLECGGMCGKIISFEDTSIRWEVIDTETGIGQTAVQYRCLPQDLQPMNGELTIAVIEPEQE